MNKKKTRVIGLLLLAVVLFSLSGITSAHAEAPRFTYFYVTNTNSSGAGSLRQAILDANVSVGRDHIVFNIPTSDPGYHSALGVWFIELTIVLPQLADPDGIVIDGSTQPGTHAYLPGINIMGTTSLPPGCDIFTIIGTSQDNTIANLGILNSRGTSIVIEGDGNDIIGNQIFTSDSYGIKLLPGAYGNRISENHLCGQTLDSIYGDSTVDNTIDNNIIGLQPDYIPVVATLGSGISLTGGSLNAIHDNTISHNGGNGIYIFNSTDNVIEDNIIGLSGDLQEQLGNKGYGILLEHGKYTQIFSNWISGNHMDGIRLVGSFSYGNQIESNNIGLSMAGTAPNHHHGIGIYDNAHDNNVGRDFDLNYANFIAFNGWSGVVVVNSIGHNYIGTNIIFSNQFYGVHIKESWSNRILSNTIVGNGIAGTNAGVRIENASGSSDLSDNNLIKDNSIGNNAGLGIELVGDANAEILPPVINAATCTQVTGSSACGGCSVQLFSDFEDEGLYPEGTVSTDGSGYFAWTGSLHGPNVTATVIDPAGNTSQFSIPVIDGCRRNYLPLITR